MSFSGTCMIMPPDGTAPTATVIFLHGLGQSAESWLPWVGRLSRTLTERLSPAIKVKWILPQAEIGPITCEENIPNPRWFDVHTLPTQSPSIIHHISSQHEKSIPTNNALVGTSLNSLSSIIESETRSGIPTSNILLVGFSQGGCMAIITGLFNSNVVSPLGGVGVIGGWMLREFLSDQRWEITHPSPPPPLFWAHGELDKTIPLSHAEGVLQWLKERGYADREEVGESATSLASTNRTAATHKTQWHVYSGLGHDVDDRVFVDLATWIATVLE